MLEGAANGARARLSLLCCGQSGDNLVLCGGGPFLDFLRPQSAQGMGDYHWLKLGPAQHPGVEVGGAQEGSGADHHRRNSPVLQGHRVVHTARGTGASIGDGCNDKVAPGGQGIDDVIGSGPGVNKLFQRDSVS